MVASVGGPCCCRPAPPKCSQPSRISRWILAIGPLFAALAGIGFKEFFCFQRPEAIGLTLLLPAALLGHLVGLINGPPCLARLCSAALLLVLLALRKFGMDAAADVGDKSVFAYLDGQLPAGTP